ncbi:MAG: histidine phosphatase family protein [Patescibacteria group bacterium]|nr:histidine phosphatase family protein [Patescibacteria group bacterium]
MNQEDVVRGWTETALDEEGERHARKLGKELKDSRVDCLIASDLLRTMQTAMIVSEESGIPIVALSPNLHTWNVGEYTGKPTDTVDPILERMAEEEPEKEIKNGESFNNFKTRFLLQVIALMNEYSDKTVAFVVHGRNLAVMNAWCEAGCPSDFELDNDHLGYEDFPPATAHAFTIKSCYLI